MSLAVDTVTMCKREQNREREIDNHCNQYDLYDLCAFLPSVMHVLRKNISSISSFFFAETIPTPKNRLAFLWHPADSCWVSSL